LFVVESFFDRDLCSRLRADMHAGVSSAATVGSHGAEFVVDRDVRRVTQARINDASTVLVKTRLMGLKPDLERHFGIALADCQAPQFLHYVTGDFYQPHCDNGARDDAAPSSKSRRIWAVIFLNGTSAEPRDDTYGGGALTFYKLFDDPVGRSIGFPLEAATKVCSSAFGPTSRIVSPGSRTGIGTRSLAGISEPEILFVVRHSLIAPAPGAQAINRSTLSHRNPKQRKRRRGPAQMVFVCATMSRAARQRRACV
jgi:predicted 2-oxoglutarate/Fe(II)-dependent dioxygenase YbiX